VQEDFIPGEVGCLFKQLLVKNELPVPSIAKALGIAPIARDLPDDWLVIRNYGERMPLAGGCFHTAYAGGAFYGKDTHPAYAEEVVSGLFSRLLNAARDNTYSIIGARSAFVPL